MSGQPEASSEKPAGPLASPEPWNLVAEGYERSPGNSWKPYSRSGLAMLRYGGETRVIDVACGPGTTSLLSRRPSEVHLPRFLRGHARLSSAAMWQPPARPTPRSSRPTARRCHFRQQLRPRRLDVRPDVLPRSRQGICRTLPRSRRPVGRCWCRAGRRSDHSPLMRVVSAALQPDGAATPDARRLSGLEDRAVFEDELREAGFTDIRIEAVTHGLRSRASTSSGATWWRDGSDHPDEASRQPGGMVDDRGTALESLRVALPDCRPTLSSTAYLAVARKG